MARKQTLVQLSDELVSGLDRRAAREGRTRSALIRDALEVYLNDELEAEVDRRIVEGYERRPQNALDDGWALRSAIDAIREEPW